MAITDLHRVSWWPINDAPTVRTSSPFSTDREEFDIPWELAEDDPA